MDNPRRLSLIHGTLGAMNESRLVLRPGFAVLRRDPGALQVGLHPPQRAILPDTEPVRDLLDLLLAPHRRWQAPTEARATHALADLVAAGLVVADVDTHGAHAQTQAHGATWGTQKAKRAHAVVRVSGEAPVVGALIDLLAAEGVAGSAYEPSEEPLPPSDALWVAISAGPVRRELFDQALGPSLSVTFGDGRCEIGPFTVPAESVCLRCVDAGRCDTDPRWPLLVEQASLLSYDPPALDLAATRLALALTVREVLSWSDGQEPSSYGATVTVPATGLPERTTWRRHPACGCTWSALLLSG